MKNLPTDWKDYSFGDIVKFSGGAQPPRSTFKFEAEDGYVRLIQTRDYKSDKYVTYIPEEFARKKCKKNDIMIGRYGPPIFQILRGLEGAYNVALLKAIPDEEQLMREYLFYYISQYDVWSFVENLSQRSGGQTGIDLTKLREYHFPLPPLPEQQKIAEILSTVDAKIEVIDQQITETQELKKGLMQRLLTKGIGHSEFKDSPLGKIPKSWEVLKVQTISKVIDSLHKTPVFSEKGYPMVRVGDINKDLLNLNNCLKVNKEVLDAFNKNHQPKTGDILMTRVGSFGKTILVNTEETFCIGQNTVVITEINNPEFLYQTFNSSQIQKQFNLLTNGSSQPSLSLKDIRNLQISFPPVEEQQKIANILSSVDEKLEVLAEKKVNYQELKQGLMQQLLTGKIRVKV